MFGLPPRPSLSPDVGAALVEAERRPIGARPPEKLSYTHDAMIDLIIANPAISQGDLARSFGYTQSWVCVVMSTDMFKARLAARKAEVVNPLLSASVEERWDAVTRRSLEVIQEKLSKEASEVPDQLALRAAELGSKALGIGGNAPPPSPPLDHLTSLASRLTSLLGNAKGTRNEILERVEVVDVPSRDAGSSDGRTGSGEANPADTSEADPAA